MIIKGFQKLSLIDYPGKLAAVIFLQGCNFKCGFCHNPELVLPNSEKVEGSKFGELKEYSEEEILEFLKNRKQYLDGLCITGGEPLLTLEIDFLKKVKELGYLIKIDTNGCYPNKLKEIISLGLVDYVAMDIKGSKEDYEKLINVKPDFEAIEESIKLISSLPEYEFRTTVINGIHNEENLKKMFEWLSQASEKGKLKKFYFQGFKNQGKFIDPNFTEKKDTEDYFLKNLKSTAFPYFESVEVRV